MGFEAAAFAFSASAWAAGSAFFTGPFDTIGFTVCLVPPTFFGELAFYNTSTFSPSFIW